MALEGHVKPVLRITFHPLAIMQQLAVKIIFAGYHTSPLKSCIPSLSPRRLLAGHIIVWSGRYFKPVKTLSAHEAKVTSLNINAGSFPNLDKGLERAAINRIVLTLPERKKNMDIILQLSHMIEPSSLYTSRSNNKHAMEVE
ncbi:hypothetical protein NC653_036036 [Populus alba x Populus x berolinensis]|uniref:Uncharacterized protein n=1 Tax=Populus alba x Populus x berolinensis TaxID=444605 RepID=A0AAD6LJ45_9ROSI|nr:hypothetical protein NC653_036036 [Populus alba x Populus x berolinensis]